MDLLRYAAKFDPFLPLDCARVEGVGAQSKERKGSNFAIWQPCRQEHWRAVGQRPRLRVHRAGRVRGLRHDGSHWSVAGRAIVT